MPNLWSWVLCDEDGNALPGASVGRGRRLIFEENQESEARMTFSLQDVAAEQLFNTFRNGIPQLRVYRDGTLVFSGLWTPQNGGSSADGQSYVNCIFKDAYHRLRSRYMRVETTFTSQDSGAILKSVVDTTNTLSDTTIRTATAPATETRTRTYEIGKQLGEIGDELTTVLDGFDWYPTYLDPTTQSGKTMQLNILANRGSNREDVRFEFGETTLANINSYMFTSTLPVTRAIGLGNVITSEKSSSPAESVYGTYMTVVSATDVAEQATLDDKAQDAIRESVAHVSDITVDPNLAPTYWDDFEIGDTVRVGIDDGAMQLDLSPRINSVEIGLDDSDNVEDMTIGFDSESQESYVTQAMSSRAYVRYQREIERRLANLEVV